MNKCLRITVKARFPKDFLQTYVQKNANKLAIEGTAQYEDTDQHTAKIIICGPIEVLDQFIDLMHNGPKNFVYEDIEIEPFLKDKDYRSVFRVIE